jgi:hypothetical protein
MHKFSSQTDNQVEHLNTHWYIYHRSASWFNSLSHTALENRQNWGRQKKCWPKSYLGRHVSTFLKICFHVLEH